MQRLTVRRMPIAHITLLAVAFSILFGVQLTYAQTASEAQLRSTISAEVQADPRSQTMSQAQMNALVNSLTAQAEAQGITAAQLTYRPSIPGIQTEAPTTLSLCSGFSCSLGSAFGLDGSIPIIPIALFVAAALFIVIFSLMREMGHPHAQA